MLNQQSPTMGLNGTGILQMAVSREMTKRGFNASKSADSRTSNDIAGESLDNDRASLSPPQVYGHRKKLTDLKIDLNFVPKKNKVNKNISLPSPNKIRASSEQPRIRAMSTGTPNGTAGREY